MICPEKAEQGLYNAIGKFEYSVDGGAIVYPGYKYVYFNPAGAVPLIFLGRNTPTIVLESGILINFGFSDFWGGEVVIGNGVSISYKSDGISYSARSGFLTGLTNASKKAGSIAFEFIVNVDERDLQVEGQFLLMADSAVS